MIIMLLMDVSAPYYHAQVHIHTRANSPRKEGPERTGQEKPNKGDEGSVQCGGMKLEE